MKTANGSDTALKPAPAATGLLEGTTDLSAIQGNRALVLLDEQNLTIGARRLDRKLNYRLLAERLRLTAKVVDLHLFTDIMNKENWYVQRFKRQGYKVHLKAVRYILLADGSLQRDTNVDNLFAFWTGFFVKSPYDVIVLGSGDFGLAGELAKAISGVAAVKRPTVMTLSLPGSTARALDVRRNGHIKANMKIGLDMLKS